MGIFIRKSHLLFIKICSTENGTSNYTYEFCVKISLRLEPCFFSGKIKQVYQFNKSGSCFEEEQMGAIENMVVNFALLISIVVSVSSSRTL